MCRPPHTGLGTRDKTPAPGARRFPRSLIQHAQLCMRGAQDAVSLEIFGGTKLSRTLRACIISAFTRGSMQIFSLRLRPYLLPALLAHLCLQSLAAWAEPPGVCAPEVPCCGAFRHPFPGLREGPGYERKEIDARHTRQEADGSVHLEGGVRIRQGRRQLEAEQVHIAPGGDEAQLSGEVRLLEAGALVEGREARLRIDSGDGVLETLRYTLFETPSQGRAASLHKNGSTLQLEDATWSSCPPQREWWHIRAAEMRIDGETDYLTARNLQLRMGRVPVLYLPWFGFPVGETRHSGLLQPNIAYSRSDGIDWSQPLYLNLAPNYDALITPRYIEDRGTMLQGEFRWLLPQLRGQIQAAHLEEDRSAADARRWLYRFQLEEHGSRHWDGFVRYAKSSDANYLYDFEFPRPPYLEQRGALQYANRNWLLRLESIDYQALRGSATDAFYRQQPTALLRYRSDRGSFQPEYLLQAEYSDFQASTATLSDGSRLYAEAGIAWPMRWRGGHFRPWAKLRFLEHSPQHAAKQGITALSAGFSAALGWQRSIGPAGRSLRQTLEPQLLYFYTRERAAKQEALPVFQSGVREFTPQQLFRESRFSGRDRIADDNRLSLVLQSRILDERSGRELLGLQLGQIFYFADREVFLDGAPRDPTLSHSPLAARWRWHPSAHWLWRGETIVDTRRGRMDAGLWELRYEDADEHSLLRLVHRYDRFHPGSGEALEQAQLRLDFPRGNWRFFGNWDYDIEREQDILAEGGFRFSGCCWTVGLRWNRTLEDAGLWDNSVSFEFSLHGFGAF